MTILRETAGGSAAALHHPSFDYEPVHARAPAPPVPQRRMSLINEQRFTPRQCIFKEGQRALELYEIVEGCVLLTKHLPDGRRQVVEILKPGSMFGLAAGDTYDCTASAVSETVVRRIERSRVEGSERLQRELNQRLLEKLADLHEHALLLGRKTAVERIATLLARLFQSDSRPLGYGEAAPALRTADMALTQTDMADYLGLTVETVSRTLTRLKREGVIAVSGKGQLRVLDDARLQALSVSEVPLAAAS